MDRLFDDVIAPAAEVGAGAVDGILEGVGSIPAEDLNKIAEATSKTIDDRRRIQELLNAPEEEESVSEYNPVVPVENKKKGKCNTLYKSGSVKPEQYTIKIPGGFYDKYTYWFQHFDAKDRARVFDGNRLIFDTGCRGKSETKALGAILSRELRIVIDPLCDPSDKHTKWNLSLRVLKISKRSHYNFCVPFLFVLSTKNTEQSQMY